MNPSSFDDLGIDAISGTEIMGLLGLSAYQLNDPITMNRVMDVVNYLKNIPDKSFFVNRITVGKKIEDKLAHVWTYIELQKKRESLEGQRKIADIELQTYSEKMNSGALTDMERSLAMDVSRIKTHIDSELSKIKEEEFAYEK